MIQSPEQWRILPLSKIIEILAIMPPPPAVVNGQLMAFVDPKAAERLHWIRDQIMEALAQAADQSVLTAAARQEALNQAHRAVDACGGTYSVDEQRSGYSIGHKAALDAALAEIEKMGGEWRP